MISTQADNVDLMLLERTFRPLRSLSVAKAENRIHGDLCFLLPREAREFTAGTEFNLENVKAFQITEAMEGFGGEDFVSSHCLACPANIYRVQFGNSDMYDVRQYAGCYGLLQSSYDEFSLFDHWQSKIDLDPKKWNCHEGFRLDQIWRTSHPEQPRYLDAMAREIVSQLIENTVKSDFFHADLKSLGIALAFCMESNSRIQIKVIPKGQIENRSWILPQHCSSCIRPLELWSGKCPNCNTTIPPRPERKRHLKGDRPYWPLINFVGTSEAARIANEYFRPIESGGNVRKSNED